jgi:ABC-2 type transport system ATP-binding protein
MDEAGRCDRLLLLRDGELIADSTPAQLRVDGRSQDLEEAFLNVVRAREEVGVTRARHGAHRASEEESLA